MNNSKRKLRRQLLELPRWLSDKESSCQYRRHRFNPWPGKIPHAVEQMNHNYSALMQQLPKPTDLKSPCSTAREATAMRSPCTATTESPPLSAAREKAHPAKKTQHKKKKWKKKRESNSYIYPHLYITESLCCTPKHCKSTIYFNKKYEEKRKQLHLQQYLKE